jgi:hypothetical protein
MGFSRCTAAAACLALFLAGAMTISPAPAHVTPPSKEQLRDIEDCLAKSQESDVCERAYLVFTTYKAVVRGALKTYGSDPKAMRKMTVAMGNVTARLSGERLGLHDVVFVYSLLQCVSATKIVQNAMVRRDDYPRARRFARMAVAMGDEALSIPVSQPMLAQMKRQLHILMTEARSNRAVIEARR